MDIRFSNIGNDALFNLKGTDASKNREDILLFDSNDVSVVSTKGVAVERGSGGNPEGVKHTVKKGENLSVIAKKYGITVKQLQKANNITGENIQEGKSLIIPNIKEYTVKGGDTLSQIAQRNGITVKQITDINKGLSSKNLQKGQKILLPVPEPAPKTETPKTEVKADKKQETKSDVKTHTVKYGDTLSQIAEKNGVTMAELMDANPNLTADIKVGDKIIIPKPQPKPEVKAQTKPEAKSDVTKKEDKVQEKSSEKQGGRSVYTVKSGDTAGKISREYGIPLAVLARANKISPENINKLKIGQKLVIPELYSNVIGLKESSFNTADSNYAGVRLTSAINTALNNSRYQNDPAAMEFFKRLAFMESSFDLNAKSGQFVGLYQIGKSMCKDVKIQYSNISGNPSLQQKTIEKFLETEGARYIKHFGLDKFIGKKIKLYISVNGKTPRYETVEITAAGLFAGMHLIGIGGLVDTLKNGKIVKDDNGTSAGFYLRMMQDVKSKAITDLLS